jgi:hypothetical protein
MSGTQRTLCGYVLMLPFGGSSKSASIRPFLITDCYEPQRLLYRGDNPYSNQTMWPYHLKYCRVSYEKEGDLLIVDNIEELPDPCAPSKEGS